MINPLPNIERTLKRLYEYAVFPIKNFPGEFLTIGILLFVPEILISYFGIGGGIKQLVRETIRYSVEHLGNSMAFSFVVSWLLCCVFSLLIKTKAAKVVSIATVSVISIYSISRVWLNKVFGISDIFTALELIRQTNGSESKEFVSTYMLNGTFLITLAIIAVIVFGVVVLIANSKLSKRICSLILRYGIVLLLLVWAAPMSVKKVVSVTHAVFQKIGDKPLMNTENNILWQDIRTKSVIDAVKIKMDYDKMCFNPIVDSCSFLSKNIVIVLGESYNKAHSSMYGYPLATSDCLKKYHPIIFCDAISPVNQTHEALRMLFSLHTGDLSKEWSKAPLVFPLLRKAGYNVTYYSNQFNMKDDYNVWEKAGALFIDNKTISDCSFDRRNTNKYQYDGELLDHFFQEYSYNEENNVFIIHFNGQHVNALERFPKEVTYYTSESINREYLSIKEKQQIADYDNAIRYGDLQLSRVLDFFQDEDAIIFFFSDHGDEINDCRPHVGRAHDFSTMPPAALHCQFDVPFIVFTTDKYKVNHPAIIQQLERAKDKPFVTDAFAHTLLYLAGVHTESYQTERNILDDKYDATRKRILYKSGIDYDEVCGLGDKVIGF